MHRFTYLLMSCPITYGFQKKTNAVDSEREKDVYAIYSLMLTPPQTSHGPDDNERYLLAATTAPGVPQVPCVRPPMEHEADFREVLVDYENRKSTPPEPAPLFSLRKPYALVRTRSPSSRKNVPCLSTA